MRDVTVNVAPDGSLLIPLEIARRLGLVPQQTVVIEQHDDVILITPQRNGEGLLNELDGCLGEEKAQAYNFDLKIGGLYEAR